MAQDKTTLETTAEEVGIEEIGDETELKRAANKAKIEEIATYQRKDPIIVTGIKKAEEIGERIHLPKSETIDYIKQRVETYNTERNERNAKQKIIDDAKKEKELLEKERRIGLKEREIFIKQRESAVQGGYAARTNERLGMKAVQKLEQTRSQPIKIRREPPTMLRGGGGQLPPFLRSEQRSAPPSMFGVGGGQLPAFLREEKGTAPSMFNSGNQHPPVMLFGSGKGELPPFLRQTKTNNKPFWM